MLYIIQNLDSFLSFSILYCSLYVTWRQYSFYHFSPCRSIVGVDHLIVFATNLFVLSLIISSALRHSFLSSPLPRLPSTYFCHWLLDYISCPNEFIPQQVELQIHRKNCLGAESNPGPLLLFSLLI